MGKDEALITVIKNRDNTLNLIQEKKEMIFSHKNAIAELNIKIIELQRKTEIFFKNTDVVYKKKFENISKFIFGTTIITLLTSVLFKDIPISVLFSIVGLATGTLATSDYIVSTKYIKKNIESTDLLELNTNINDLKTLQIINKEKICKLNRDIEMQKNLLKIQDEMLFEKALGDFSNSFKNYILEKTISDFSKSSENNILEQDEKNKVFEKQKHKKIYN